MTTTASDSASCLANVHLQMRVVTLHHHFTLLLKRWYATYDTWMFNVSMVCRNEQRRHWASCFCFMNFQHGVEPLLLSVTHLCSLFHPSRCHINAAAENTKVKILIWWNYPATHLPAVTLCWHPVWTPPTNSTVGLHSYQSFRKAVPHLSDCHSCKF